MSFDLGTAQPEQETQGFDVNSAQPENSQVVQLSDKGMNISTPVGMPDHQMVNAVRDSVYGNDQQASVPEEGKPDFIKGLSDNLQNGFANGMDSILKISGLDKNKFIKDNLELTPEEQTFSAKESQKDIEQQSGWKQYAEHFSNGVGGLLSTLPLFQVAGDATVGAIASAIPSVVTGVLSQIPRFAIGASEFGAAQEAEKYQGAGAPIQALGAVQGATEGLFWNTLYGNSGRGLAMFPKMVGINIANTSYEALKQNRLPTSKELYMAGADGLAYAAVFSLMPHLQSKSSNEPEKVGLSDIGNSIQEAVKNVDIDKAQQSLDDIQNHPDITPETKQVVSDVFNKVQEATQEQARKLLGEKPEETITPEEKQEEGQEVKTEEKVWPPTLPEGFKGEENATQRGESIEGGSGQEGIEGQTQAGVHLRDASQGGMEAKGSKIGNESGQIDVSMLPFVNTLSEKVENAGDFLKESQKEVPQAKNFQQGMYMLDGANGADEIRGHKFLDNIIKNNPLTDTEREGLHQFMDETENNGKSETPLNDKQQAVLDELSKLQKASNVAFNKVIQAGVPVESLHLPRMVEGKGNIFEKIKSGVQNISGSILRKTAPEFKERVMKAIEDEEGNRQIVAIKKGQITAFDNGNAQDLGKLDIKNISDIQNKEVKPFYDQIKRLENEQKVLLATKGRQEVAKERLKNIQNEIDNLGEKISDKLVERSPDDLSKKVFVDKNGKEWNITQATVKEIEANTDLKYYKDPVVQVLDSYLRLRRVERAVDFLESVKNDPDFEKVAMRFDQGGAIPDGWKPTQLAQFKGYALDPKVADTMDSFQKQMHDKNDPFNLLMGINRFIRVNMFLNPIVHPLNVGTSWAYARGVSRWFVSSAYQRLYGAIVKSVTAVKDLNEDYMKVLENGGNLMSSDVRLAPLRDLIEQKITSELQENEPLRDNIAKALGYVNPANLVKGYQKFNETAAWVANDFFTLTHIYEKEAEGLDEQKAIADASKWIPDYRIPSRVLGSKAIADTLKDPRFTMFSGYHYGILKSIGEGMKSILPNSLSIAERAEALDKVAALAIINCVVYPALDKLFQQLTDNKDASVRRSGPAGMVDNTYNMIKGKMPWQWWVMSTITPSPVLKSASELATNNIIGTKKDIFHPEDTFGQKAQDFAKYAKEQIGIGKLSEQVGEGKKTIGESFLNTLGVRTPHFAAHTDAEQQAMNIKFESPNNKNISEEEQKSNQEKYNLEDKYAKSKDISILNDAVSSHQISQYQANQIKKFSKEPSIVRLTKGFDYQQLESVYNKGNADEKKLLLPLIEKNLNNQIKKVVGNQKEELKAQLKKYQGAS